MIAVALRASGGDSVWPGQLISLLCVALTAALLFAALARRFGPVPAYVALLTLLGHQGMVIASTTIQPDPLALLVFTAGFLAFARYLEVPGRGWLLAWIAATTIAGLVKPTTLELGIAQGMLVLLSRRDALRWPSLWLGWALVLAAVGLFLIHARSLYLEYGNTFGVLSGGDSKLPALAAVLSPATWFGLVRFTVIWGIGLPAVPAAIVLAWRRRLGAEELALAAGAAVLSLLALRYTSGPFGSHYHLPHVVLGAWLVAHATAELGPWLASRTRRRLDHRALIAIAAVVSIALGARAVGYLRQLPPEPETAVGRMLAAVAPPGALVVVRARAPRRDPQWGTVNNCEDPRVFYLSRTHGWVIANDEPGAAPVADLVARGATFYAHVEQMAPDPELAAWLAAHAELVATDRAGRIYRLSSRLSSRTK
jgi:4-amino-4-deoxy-L-arabinose transferase-like glycosyltransferase